MPWDWYTLIDRSFHYEAMPEDHQFWMEICEQNAYPSDPILKFDRNSLKTTTDDSYIWQVGDGLAINTTWLYRLLKYKPANQYEHNYLHYITQHYAQYTPFKTNFLQFLAFLQEEEESR